MFNLENIIQNWKRQLRKNPAFEDGDIVELESHLRDEIDRLKAEGLSDQQAFERASADIGKPQDIGDELYKSRATQTAGPVPPWKRVSWFSPLLPNYLKTVIRNIRRDSGYSFINIAGLALGLAVFLFIVLFIRNELSYDQFHDKADRTYRVTYKVVGPDKEEHYAVAVPGLAPVLQTEFPEILQSMRISLVQDLTIRIGQQNFGVDHYYHADSTFFEVFDFTLAKGNPSTALSGPNRVVLSKEIAGRFFGEVDPVGKTITAVYGEGYEEQLEVSGVAEVPDNSHFGFNMLVSFETLQNLYPLVNDQNWWMRTAYTYVVLPDGYNPQRLQQKLPQVVRSHMSDMQQRSGSSYFFELQSLPDIHLHSHLLQELKANGDIRVLYIFGCIAILVLVIACINFMNLATARAAERSKEVGVRKTLGADHWQLVRQFYLESAVVVLLAGVMALAIIYGLSPLYEQLTGKGLGTGAIFSTEIILIWFIVMLLVVIASASYPAIVLSSFNSADALTGTVTNETGDLLIRKGLVVFQFTVSVVMLIGLLVIQRQLDYVMEKDLGYQKEQVLIIPISNSVGSHYNSETISQELLQHPGIRKVAHASHIPTRMLSNNTMIVPEGAMNNQPQSITMAIASASFKETLGLELKQGRDFSSRIATDTAAYIINETAADYFGWEKPIGKSIKDPDSGEELGKVIGVYKNFHIQSLHQNIEAVIFRMTPADRYRYAILRLDPSSISAALDHSEKVWSDILPAAPFDYFFLDDRYQQLYEKEERTGKLIAMGSLLAIIIACLGLFGLAAHSTERRTKEIGIRKVMGASVMSLISLLSKDMIRLVLTGFILAVPLSYLIAGEWLQQFAYRAGISWKDFLLAGIITSVIALTAVSSQAIRAAVMDPVKSLRSE